MKVLPNTDAINNSIEIHGLIGMIGKPQTGTKTRELGATTPGHVHRVHLMFGIEAHLRTLGITKKVAGRNPFTPPAMDGPREHINKTTRRKSSLGFQGAKAQQLLPKLQRLNTRASTTMLDVDVEAEKHFWDQTHLPQFTKVLLKLRAFMAKECTAQTLSPHHGVGLMAQYTEKSRCS